MWINKLVADQRRNSGQIDDTRRRIDGIFDQGRIITRMTNQKFGKSTQLDSMNVKIDIMDDQINHNEDF